MFEYIICDETFPATDRAEWVKLIKHAFGQWQEATSDWITVTGDETPPCATGPFGDFIAQDDVRSEVRMFDPTVPGFFFSKEFKSDVFKVCVDKAPACVTSFEGYSRIGTDDSARDDINEIVENYREDPVKMLAKLAVLLGRTIFASREGKNVLQGVDVSFNKEKLDSSPLNIPGGDAKIDPGDVRFNTCLMGGVPDANDRGGPFYAYQLTMHEAGHALGLSNINLLRPWDLQGAAHPSIPDAAMSYDGEVPKVHREMIDFEPDCSPHPFDVMAIYALYQAVPIVSISGPASGPELTWIQLTANPSDGVPPYTYQWTKERVDAKLSNAQSPTVSVYLPDVAANDSVDERTITLEVTITDFNGTVATEQHMVEVKH